MTGAVNLSFGALPGRENRRQAEKTGTEPSVRRRSPVHHSSPANR